MRQFGQIQYGCFSVPAISTAPWHAGHVGVSNLESISSMKCPSLSPRERPAARPSVEEPGRAPGPGAVLSPHRLKRCERTSCSSEQCPLLRPSAYVCELREGVPQVGDWRSPGRGCAVADVPSRAVPAVVDVHMGCHGPAHTEPSSQCPPVQVHGYRDSTPERVQFARPASRARVIDVPSRHRHVGDGRGVRLPAMIGAREPMREVGSDVAISSPVVPSTERPSRTNIGMVREGLHVAVRTDTHRCIPVELLTNAPWPGCQLMRHVRQ